MFNFIKEWFFKYFYCKTNRVFVCNNKICKHSWKMIRVMREDDVITIICPQSGKE